MLCLSVLLLLSTWECCWGLIPSSVNVGSVLFDAEDLKKTNWSNNELALLKSRMIFQKILPPNNLLIKYSVEQTCTHLLSYFKASYAMVKNEAPSPDIENILALSLSDVIGGYMKAVILPMAKLAYYSGSLSYITTFNVFEYYDKIRKCVGTNGEGWLSPQEQVLVIVTRHIHKRHTYRRNIHNTCSQITFSADEEESVPTLSMPKIERNTNTSFVILPLRAGTHYSLSDPKTADAIFKYYDAVFDCLETDPIDLAEFYVNFQEWLHSNIVCRLSEDNIHQGFAGVLKLFDEPNLHRIFTRQCDDDESESKFSKKFMFLITVGLIELAWAACALLLVYFKKNGFNKQDDEEIVVYSRSGGTKETTGCQSYNSNSSFRPLQSECSDSKLLNPKRCSTEMQTDKLGYEIDRHSATCFADLLLPMVEKNTSANQFPSKSELYVETFPDLTNLPLNDNSPKQSFYRYPQTVGQAKTTTTKSSKNPCLKIIDTSKPSECGMFVKPDEIMLTVLRQDSSSRMYPTERGCLKCKDSVDVKRDKCKKMQKKKEHVKFNEVVQLSSSDSHESPSSVSCKGSLSIDDKCGMRKSLIKPTKRVFINEPPKVCEKSCLKNSKSDVTPIEKVCHNDLCKLRKELEGFGEVVGREQASDDSDEVDVCIEDKSSCNGEPEEPQECLNADCSGKEYKLDLAQCIDDDDDTDSDNDDNCEGLCLQSCAGVCTCPTDLGSPIAKTSMELMGPVYSPCQSNRSNISVEIFDTSTNQTALKIIPLDPCLEIKLDTPNSEIRVGVDGNPKISPKRCSKIPVRRTEVLPHTSTPKPQGCDPNQKEKKSRIPKIMFNIDKGFNLSRNRRNSQKSCKAKCDSFNDTM